MSNKQTSWFLVSNCGINFPLHQTMISLGKEGCDVVLQSRSVDKRHALITFDHYEKRFKVKDLNSINGTYLNEIRISSHTFIKLEHLDTLRFGFDVTVYQIQQVVETFPVPVIPDYRLCSWKVAPYSHHSMKMSECQGCLQKQTIQHTCGLKGHEWVAGNPSSAEEVRLQSTEGCIQPHLNPQNDQICAQMPTDTCGNFFPRSNAISTKNNSLQPRSACCLPQTIVISQQQAAAEGLAIENKNCSPTDNCSSDGNFTHHPYSLPQGQPNFSAYHPCVCSPHAQVSSPSEATHCSKPVFLSPHLENVRSNTSKSVGCSSNTSLQSTFSGDSLDITLDDTTVQQKGLEQAKPQSVSRGVPIAMENVRPNAAVGKNVMEAEKPLDSSMLPIDCGSVAAVSRPVCTAFTIEFDDDPSTSKKLDIKDSISKFAPPKADCETKVGHRRNVLELFSDENGNCGNKGSDCTTGASKQGNLETEEREGRASPTMKIVSAAKDKLTKSGMQKGGYHSDGHASSDQEGIDEISAKSDPERRFNFERDYFEVVGLPIKLAERKPACLSPKPNGTIGHRSLPAGNLKDSAKYLINKMFGEITAPTNSPTEPISPTILSALHDDEGKTQRSGPPLSSPSTLRALRLTKDSKGVIGSDSRSMFAVGNKAEEGMRGKSRSSTRNEWKEDQQMMRENDEQIKEMVFLDEEDYINDQEDGKEGRLHLNEEVKQDENVDNVSEAGTYTIESDQKDSKEETQARKNIDTVFGINEKSVAFNRPIVEYQGRDLSTSELGQRNVDSAPSKRSNNGLKDKSTPVWLKEWVARSALESNDVLTSAPTDISNVNARLQHSMQVAIGAKNGTNESITQRQRRRLPIPPVERLHVALPFKLDITTTLSQMATSPNANEKLRASSSSTSPDGRRSDSSIDTETILKETENVVSAMEARMDFKLQRSNSGDGETTSIQCDDCKDSGGESDVDTSTASGTNEAISCGTYRKNSRQLVTQMTALENDHCSDRLYRKTRTARDCYQGRSTPTGEFGGNYSEGETASVHSDISSSSEVSGSSPASSRKCTSDKAPLMRFNRAFSLRRARLDCDSDGAGKHSSVYTKATTAPAVSRPSSSSSVGSSKEGPRRISASNRSDSGGSAVSAGTPNASSCNFERSDGGRFSLRLPKSAPAIGRTRLKTAASNQSGCTKGKGNIGGKTAPTPRSNSTLSSKELEMKNWKRRKEYDPLKAAAEGRKKDSTSAKTKLVTATSIALSKSEAHSPISAPFTRSVSFHGTDGLINLRRNTFTSEDEIAGRTPPDVMMHHGNLMLPTDAFGPIYDLSLKCRPKKSSEDECTSEATRAYSHMNLTSECAPVSSPKGSPLLYPVHRHKSKIDALDNLVISTINQVSSNLRGKAEEILKKLGGVHRQECVQCFGVEGLTDLLEKLANGDSPDLSPQGSSVSRQLSGILKNMKRLEESLQAIHKVLDSAIHAEGSGIAKLNGKSKCREDVPSRMAHSSIAKKKSNSRHQQPML